MNVAFSWFDTCFDQVADGDAEKLGDGTDRVARAAELLAPDNKARVAVGDGIKAVHQAALARSAA